MVIRHFFGRTKVSGRKDIYRRKHKTRIVQYHNVPFTFPATLRFKNSCISERGKRLKNIVALWPPFVNYNNKNSRVPCRRSSRRPRQTSRSSSGRAPRSVRTWRGGELFINTLRELLLSGNNAGARVQAAPTLFSVFIRRAVGGNRVASSFNTMAALNASGRKIRKERERVRERDAIISVDSISSEYRRRCRFCI